MVSKGSIALLLVLLAVTGVTALAGTPAAAQSEESGVLDALDDSGGDGMIADDALGSLGSAVKGWSDRQAWKVKRSGVNPWSEGPENTAQQEADGLVSYTNQNNATYENYSWMQSKVDADTDIQTVQLTLHVDGESATRYLLANATSDGGNYTDIHAVQDLPSDRSVDGELHLCGMAAENAEEELQHFTEEFAEPDEPLTQDYYAEMGSKYGPDVEDRYGNIHETTGECP